jgi:hypothetical protein
MATKKPTMGERLDQARVDLQTLEQQIRDLDMQRAAALLADNDREATALGLRLDEARQVVRTITDKCALLQIECEKEQVEAAKRRHENHVREFEQTLARADVAGDELQATVMVLDEKFREVIRLRELALSMWPHGKSSHSDAAARAVEGCAMAGGAISILLQHELHRIGSEPLLGGRPGERVKVPLPGGAPSRLTPAVDRKTGQLVPLKPLGEVLRTASRFAVATLRGNLFVPAVVPQPAPTGPRLVFGGDEQQAIPEQQIPARQPAPTPAQSPAAASDIDPLREYVPPAFRDRLATLHARQMQLAMSDDDTAYAACLQDLAALRSEIEAARSATA